MYILEQRYGNDGYAFWFKLLEMLGQSEGHLLDLNEEANLEFLHAKTRQNEVFTLEILDLLARLGAIDKDLWQGKIVWSQNFVDGIADVYRNRRVDLPVKPDFYSQKPTSNGISTCNLQTESRIGEESKVKESKVNNIGIELPEWIDKGLWNDYIEMRKKQKKPPTNGAIKLIVDRLQKLKDAGEDPSEVLKQSIISGWTGVFPVKEDNSGKSKRHSRDLPKKYTPTPDYPDLR